jgi:hypothetical protein
LLKNAATFASTALASGLKRSHRKGTTPQPIFSLLPHHQLRNFQSFFFIVSLAGLYNINCFAFNRPRLITQLSYINWCGFSNNCGSVGWGYAKQQFFFNWVGPQATAIVRNLRSVSASPLFFVLSPVYHAGILKAARTAHVPVAGLVDLQAEMWALDFPLLVDGGDYHLQGLAVNLFLTAYCGNSLGALLCLAENWHY